MDTLGYIVKDNEHLENKHVFRVTQDSFRIVGNGASITNCVSIDAGSLQDSSLAAEHHRDKCQLVPTVDGLYNQQYAGAEITTCRISNNVFYSPWSQMQGIFISDGFIRFPIIQNNTIQTASQHKITLCCIDGLIVGNTDELGNLVPIELNKLRIGGGCNVHVMTFKGPDDNYRPAIDIVRDDTLEHVTDNRFTPHKGCTNLYEFDLQGFREEAMRVQNGKGQEMADKFAEIAMDYGIHA